MGANEWESWKVGDTVIAKPDAVNIGLGPAGSVWEILASHPNFICVAFNGIKTSIYNNSRDSNPSTYFYWAVATPNPYQVGDRVRREPIDIQHIQPGALGTVTERAADQLTIQWDTATDGPHSYAWPKRAAYFSKVSTGQSPKPVLHCSRCGEYNEYAEPNQPDGTHKCWLCRKYQYR